MGLRFRSIVLIFLLGALAGLAVDFLRHRNPTDTRAAAIAADDAILNKEIGEIWVDNVSMDEAAARIEKASGVAVVIDRQNVGRSFTQTLPVNIQLPRMWVREMKDRF